MSILSEVVNTVKEILAVAKSTATGMSITLSHIPQRKETVSYPEAPVTIYRRFRGEHFLDVNEDGKEKCVSCFLCAAACPADAIVFGDMNDPESRVNAMKKTERNYGLLEDLNTRPVVTYLAKVLHPVEV